MWGPSIERRCSRPLLATTVTPILSSLKWNHSKANDYWSSSKNEVPSLVTALHHTKKYSSSSSFIFPGTVLTSRWWWTKNKRWWWWFILPGTVLTSPKVSHHATSSVTLFSPLAPPNRLKQPPIYPYYLCHTICYNANTARDLFFLLQI